MGQRKSQEKSNIHKYTHSELSYFSTIYVNLWLAGNIAVKSNVLTTPCQYTTYMVTYSIPFNSHQNSKKESFYYYSHFANAATEAYIS